MLIEYRFSAEGGRELIDTLTARLADPGPLRRSWAAGVANAARVSARSKGGRRFWRDQVAGTVEVELGGDAAEVFTRSPVAAHKEFGGPIRARNVEFLTVPFAAAARGKSVAEMEQQKGKKLFRIKSKRGNRVLGYSRKRGKKTEFVGLFALVRETRPQRPDQWWPGEEEVLTIGLDHARRHLDLEG